MRRRSRQFLLLPCDAGRGRPIVRWRLGGTWDNSAFLPFRGLRISPGFGAAASCKHHITEEGAMWSRRPKDWMLLHRIKTANEPIRPGLIRWCPSSRFALCLVAPRRPLRLGKTYQGSKSPSAQPFGSSQHSSLLTTARWRTLEKGMFIRFFTNRVLRSNAGTPALHNAGDIQK